MKISSKLLKILTISAAGVVVVSTAAGVMLGSYSSYLEYYNKKMDYISEQKYLNSLPLELLSIDAELKDNVYYYDNGRANPVVDDFQVTAHFTEKGKNFDSILMSSDYSITVPSDFATNGGKIGVSYTFTPEDSGSSETESDTSEEGPKEVTKTTEVDVSLTAVKISYLTLVENPYRVYYSDEMPFDKEGMSVKVTYNDGSYKIVDTSLLNVETNGNLTVDTVAAKVSYKEGDTTIYLDVPVSVDSASEYSDGTIISISAEGDVVINEGETIETASNNIKVRAKYANGNRLILSSDEYTITSNIAEASFQKNCILTIALKDSSVSTKFAATTGNLKNASNTHTGGTVTEEEGYINGSKEKVTSTVVTGATSYEYSVDLTYVAKASFVVRLANLADEDISLGENIVLNVNDIDIPLSNSVKLTGTKGLYDLTDISLPALVFKSGTNNIKVTINDDVKDKIAVNSFNMFTKYDGIIYSSMDEYMGAVAKSGSTFDATLDRIVDWNSTNGKYNHGLCTDGTYIYGTFTNYESLRGMWIKKFDKDGNLLATSAKTDSLFKEACAGISYYDGKLFLFKDGGGYAHINVADFVDGASFTVDSDTSLLPFEGFESKTIRDVYFSPSYQKFAVLEGSTITTFDKNFKKIKSFNPSITGNYGNIMRMSGSSEYILVNYSANSIYTPAVAVYDYDGNRAGQFIVPNDEENIGVEEYSLNLSGTNTQGLTYLDGVFYYSMICFGQSSITDSNTIFSAKVKEVSDRIESKFTFGEYISACADQYEISTSASPVAGTIGAVGDDVTGYHMGMATDGKYIYASKNTGGNGNSVLYKIDPETWQVVEKSATFSTQLPEGYTQSDDNSQIMVKDGKIYVVVYPDEDKCKVLSLETNKLNGGTPTLDSLPFEGKTSSRVRSFYYSDVTSQYAVIDDDRKLYFFDDNGDLAKEAITLKYGASKYPRSITGDDKYVYISYCANYQATLPIEVYTLNGEYIGTPEIPGISLGKKTNGKDDYGYNIQSMVCYKDNFYAGVCSWESGLSGLHIWKTSMDNTTFDNLPLKSIDVTLKTTRAITGQKTKDLVKKVVATLQDGKELKVNVDDCTFSSETITEGMTSFTICYKRVNVTKEKTFDIDVVRAGDSIGDYYVVNGSDNLNSQSFTTYDNDTLANASSYGMGGVYHDGYIYYSKCNGETKNAATVYKVDAITNEVKKSISVSHTNFNGDGERLFVKDSNLYLVVNQNVNEIYKIAISDFENDGASFIQVTDGSDVITKIKSGAIDIKYNDVTNQYAVLKSGALIITDGSGNQTSTTKISSIKLTSGKSTSPKNIFADDYYVYVAFGGNNQEQIPVNIYAWDGTLVGTIYFGIELTLSNKDYNIQSVFYNGTDLYGVVCSWGGNKNGLVKLNLSL